MQAMNGIEISQINIYQFKPQEKGGFLSNKSVRLRVGCLGISCHGYLPPPLRCYLKVFE